jgi:hypothetical protein
MTMSVVIMMITIVRILSIRKEKLEAYYFTQANNIRNRSRSVR